MTSTMPFVFYFKVCVAVCFRHLLRLHNAKNATTSEWKASRRKEEEKYGRLHLLEYLWFPSFRSVFGWGRCLWCGAVLTLNGNVSLKHNIGANEGDSIEHYDVVRHKLNSLSSPYRAYGFSFQNQNCKPGRREMRIKEIVNQALTEWMRWQQYGFIVFPGLCILEISGRF